jgi:hypothetical protein
MTRSRGGTGTSYPSRGRLANRGTKEQLLQRRVPHRSTSAAPIGHVFHQNFLADTVPMPLRILGHLIAWSVGELRLYATNPHPSDRCLTCAAPSDQTRYYQLMAKIYSDNTDSRASFLIPPATFSERLVHADAFDHFRSGPYLATGRNSHKSRSCAFLTLDSTRPPRNHASLVQAWTRDDAPGHLPNLCYRNGRKKQNSTRSEDTLSICVARGNFSFDTVNALHTLVSSAIAHDKKGSGTPGHSLLLDSPRYFTGS